MQNLWSYLTFLPSAWFGSFVNAAVILTDPSVPHLTNSTLRIDIPAEFMIRIQEPIPGPPVPAIPCLEAAIQTVGEHLAPEEFTEKIEPQAWTMFGVVIAISTKHQSDHRIERRFVVWGIYEALVLFEEQKNFRATIFSLAWRGDPCGFLAIYPEGLKSIDTSFNPPAITSIEPLLSTTPGGYNNSVSSGSKTLEDRELVLSFGYQNRPRPLDRQSTLLAILGALCDAAQWPKIKVVPGPYTVRAGPSRTQIDLKPEKILNYKWLIKALTMIPEELRGLKYLRSFWVTIWVGTLRLGTMDVVPRGPISRASNAFIEAGFNVSGGSATARKR